MSWVDDGDSDDGDDHHHNRDGEDSDQDQLLTQGDADMPKHEDRNWDDYAYVK